MMMPKASAWSRVIAAAIGEGWGPATAASPPLFRPGSLGALATLLGWRPLGPAADHKGRERLMEQSTTETLADLAEPHAPEGREDPAARALDHLARLVATAPDAPTALVWAAESEKRVILGRSGSSDARTMRRLEAFCRQVADRGELVADPD